VAITEAVGRIGGTLIAMLQTRVQLAAVELEEESRRLLGYFMLALLALILFGIAMMLVALAVIMAFWDSYRLEAAIGLAALFGAAGTVVAVKLKSRVASRPRFLSATADELNKDIDFVRNAGQSHEH